MVYRDASLLWRSAQALFSHVDGAGEIVTQTLSEDEPCPGHPRRLVERVYGGHDQLPNDLETEWDRQYAEELGEQWQARQACLTPFLPYNGETQPWIDDARIMTRLGDSVTIRLAQETVDGKLLPLVSIDGRSSDDWSNAEIRASLHLARNLDRPTDEQLSRLRPRWRKYEEGTRLLVLDSRNNDNWVDRNGCLRVPIETRPRSSTPRFPKQFGMIRADW